MSDDSSRRIVNRVKTIKPRVTLTQWTAQKEAGQLTPGYVVHAVYNRGNRYIHEGMTMDCAECNW